MPMKVLQQVLVLHSVQSRLLSLPTFQEPRS